MTKSYSLIDVYQAMADALQAEIDKSGGTAPQSLLDRKQALDEKIASLRAKKEFEIFSDKFGFGTKPHGIHI